MIKIKIPKRKKNTLKKILKKKTIHENLKKKNNTLKKIWKQNNLWKFQKEKKFTKN